LRLLPSIAPWLPWLKELLPHGVLLGGKAAELYYFSILEKPTPVLLVKDTILGVEKGGKAYQAFHDGLTRQGFQKKMVSGPGAGHSSPFYYREDLGFLEIRCPDRGKLKNPYTSGLSAIPDNHVHLLLEDPHEVTIKYLGEEFSVRIPQTGRFILAQGLQMKVTAKSPLERQYHASQCLVLILYLLVLHGELREEALNDLLQVKPASLIREFQSNLKDNGPGTAVWEGAQKFFLELFPETKAVELTSWYWKFLPALSRVLKDQKEDHAK
jgi:hypothetical protein